MQNRERRQSSLSDGGSFADLSVDNSVDDIHHFNQNRQNELKIPVDYEFDEPLTEITRQKSNRKPQSNDFRLRISRDSWQQERFIHQRNQTNIRNHVFGDHQSQPSVALPFGGTIITTQGMISNAGLDHDVECEEADFKYLKEVIQKVKEGCENQYHLGDYIQALMCEFQIPNSEEWDAIIAESKEQHTTLRRVIDIACFLLERTQSLQLEGKELSTLNSNLIKELQIAKQQNDNLAVIIQQLTLIQEEVQIYQQNAKNQQQALKDQEKHIAMLNEQIQMQQDLIRQLESNSMVSNTVSLVTKSIIKQGDIQELQDQLNEKLQKINELEEYLAEQTSNYHQEVNKNAMLRCQLKQFKDDGVSLKMQIEELQNFMEEKDSQIIDLEEFNRRLQSELIKKDLELKSMVNVKRESEKAISNPIGRVQMSIDRRKEKETNEKSKITDLTKDLSRKLFVAQSNNQKKMSEELGLVINKLRESKNGGGFKQRSFIVQQSLQEIQKAHHRRLQTISSQEIINQSSAGTLNQNHSPNFESPEFGQRQRKTVGNKSPLKAALKDSRGICNRSKTQELRVDFLSPTYSPDLNHKGIRNENSYDSKFNTNNMSPRKTNKQSKYDEDEDEVQMNSVKHQNLLQTTRQSNHIGINESDLMEFSNHNIPVGASIINYSNMDTSQRFNESNMSAHNFKSRISRKQSPQNNQPKPKTINTDDSQTKITPTTANTPQVVTVNNYNINQKFDINNFLSDTQQQEQSQEGNDKQFYETMEKIIQQYAQNNDYSNKVNTDTYKLSFMDKSNTSPDKQCQNFGSLTKQQQKQLQAILHSFGRDQNSQTKNKMEEIKLDFLNQKMNEVSIGKQIPEQSRLNNHGYSEVQCVTVDVEDIDKVQRTQMISELEFDQKPSAIDTTQNNEDKHDHSMNPQSSVLKDFFYLLVLAFQMKHQKRSTLLTINKQQLYEEAIEKEIKFYDWNKWIQKRMVQIYYEKKKMKKAQEKMTYIETSGIDLAKMKEQNQKYEMIDNHFKKC